LLRELDLEQGNISHVARKLGVGRNTLYRKMHRLHIQLARSRSRFTEPSGRENKRRRNGAVFTV